MAGRDYDSTHNTYGVQSSGVISCLNAGPNRESSFPEAFFCIQCAAYEVVKHAEPTSRIKRNSRRYGCTAARTDIQSPCGMQGIPCISYERSQTAAVSARASRPRSPTNEVRPSKKSGVTQMLKVLNAKIVELERIVGALKVVQESEAAQQMFDLQQDSAKWEHTAIEEKLRWEATTISLTQEREAHNTTHVILQDKWQVAEARFSNQISELLSLQENIDEMEIVNLVHSEENLILSQEKIAAEVKHVNLHRKHNLVSTTFANNQQLNNPQLTLCRDEKKDTLPERFDHVFTKYLTFKNLGNPCKGNIVADVVWQDDCLDAEA
jgi:hypothetical protein